MSPVGRTSIATLSLLAWAGLIPAASLESSISTSTSGQFVVSGSDFRVRGAICNLAEGAKEEVLRLLDQRDRWTRPILIRLQAPQSNQPETPLQRLQIAQTGFGFRFQLDLELAAEMSSREIRHQLSRSVLLEMMYRDVSNLREGTMYRQPPEWILDGLETTMAIPELAAQLNTSRVFSIEGFFREPASSLDLLGRTIYRAYAVALLRRLTQLPDGRHRLGRFIADLHGGSDDPFAIFHQHFGELFETKDGSPKVWLSEIIPLSPIKSAGLLTAVESERILNELLARNLETPAGAVSRLPQSRFISLQGNLRELACQANPIYRPLIFEYESVVLRFARRKTKGTAERLAQLAASRKRIGHRMRKIDDYLNWFEAAKADRASGLFADFLKAADALDNKPERQRQGDSISVYLDAVEALFRK